MTRHKWLTVIHDKSHVCENLYYPHHMDVKNYNMNHNCILAHRWKPEGALLIESGIQVAYQIFYKNKLLLSCIQVDLEKHFQNESWLHLHVVKRNADLNLINVYLYQNKIFRDTFDSIQDFITKSQLEVFKLDSETYWNILFHFFSYSKHLIEFEILEFDYIK